MNPAKLFRGNAKIVQPKFSAAQIALAWLGSALAIASVALLSHTTHQPLILGSFGASCVLLFGFPNAPFSQPRNVIVGHLLCSLIGLSFLKWFGAEWWSMSLAVSTALAAMLATRTAHPPAGSNPVIIFLTQPDWTFLLYPTLAGIAVLWLVALCFMKFTDKLSSKPERLI